MDISHVSSDSTVIENTANLCSETGTQITQNQCGLLIMGAAILVIAVCFIAIFGKSLKEICKHYYIRILLEMDKYSETIKWLKTLPEAVRVNECKKILCGNKRDEILTQFVLSECWKGAILSSNYDEAFTILEKYLHDMKNTTEIINTCQNDVTIILEDEKCTYEDYTKIAKRILRNDVFINDDFIDSIRSLSKKKFCDIRQSKLNVYDLDGCLQLCKDFKDIISEALINETYEQINDTRNSKGFAIQQIIEQAINLADKGHFDEARKHCEEAEKLTNDEEPLKGLVNKCKILLKEKEFTSLLEQIKDCFTSSNIDLCDKLLKNAEEFDDAYKERLIPLKKERRYWQPIEIIVPLYEGEQFFNIPKKKDEGEDADPYVNVNPNRNWGVLAVFDGMGGAGARKYTDINSREIHTSAYWASRIVRNSIKRLLVSRPVGECPRQYIEENLKKYIKDDLEERFKEFPEASKPLLSKMMRVLPTTLALCEYEIIGNELQVNCYWAGDSRIYLFDGEKMYFLTIDDADAPDGDPFSPANMDLAMNNAICKDRDFTINKSTISVPYSLESPVVLLAATDGCFGYYKNPIEFENLIRMSLSQSDNPNEMIQDIKDGIIHNIQQDDFSMAIIGIGNSDFECFKQAFNITDARLIMDKYFKWKSERERELQNISSSIDEIELQISTYKENLSSIDDKIMKRKEKLSKLASIFEGDEDVSEEVHMLELKNNQILSDGEESKKRFSDDIQKLQTQKEMLKKQLDALFLIIDEENIKWYQDYRSNFNVVGNISKI